MARKIKVEYAGDFAKRQTYPRIRLQGQWPREVFEPETYVQVEIHDDIIILRPAKEEPCSKSPNSTPAV